MEDPKQQLLAKLRDSANVLVTVTANPSVDQLAGAIGLTLGLNKLGKHATAIFSGRVPEIMEFLKPEATLEKNTDSLRDFIIALDKTKADKLRYKVEDTMVKIFITPYHSALTAKDLEFGQGDYNVDLIVAVGVHEQRDLDQAITSHGQILHDAVISSVNNSTAGGLGTINWVDPAASALCEMIFDLTRELQPEGLDPQMATALLTGIVSETRRFGNDKTTAKSLETSSLLVAAGANQQLVAAKMEEHPAPIPEKKKPAAPAPTAKKPAEEEKNATDTHKDPEAVPQTSGTIMIDHDDQKAAPAVDEDGEEIHIDEEGQLHDADKLPSPPAPPAPPAPLAPEPPESVIEGGQRMVLKPPTLGGQAYEPVDAPPETLMPLLSHDSGPAKLPPDHPYADAGTSGMDTPSTDTAMPSMSFASAPEPTSPPTVPPPMMPSFANAPAAPAAYQAAQPNPSDFAL